jgi:TetR/AcrR family transcriptional regulator, repressor of fatR-cypB operon
MTSDKRTAILDAMLDLVVERGFHAAPMSTLAKKSGASAGVIYHYFPSKEDIIHTLYAKVKSEKRHFMLKGYSQDLDPAVGFQKVWINAYRFYRQQNRESRFLELYETSTFNRDVGSAETGSVGEARDQFVATFRSRKDGGIFKDLPSPVLYEMSIGLALRLARRQEELRPAVLQKIASTVWKSLTSD